MIHSIFKIAIGLCLSFCLTAQENIFIDDTFGDNGSFQASVNLGNLDGGISALQSDGKIIVAGKKPFNGLDLALLRLNPDGSLDETFGEGGFADLNLSVTLNDIAIQADDKIVFAGYTVGGSRVLGAGRLTQDGQLDTTFADNGTLRIGGATTFGLLDIFVQRDGNILFAGTTSGDNPVVVRVTPEGAFDENFEVFQTSLPNANIHAVKQAPNGDVIFAGNTELDLNGTGNQQQKFFYWTLDSMGTNIQIKLHDEPALNSFDRLYDMDIQPDGKIVMVGRRNINSEIDFLIVRYNLDFTLDFVTTIDFDENDDQANNVLFQGDGKILISGNSDAFGGSKWAVARLNTDGSLDLTFSEDGKYILDPGDRDDDCQSMHLLEDGKVLLSGTTEINSISKEFIVMRLRTDIIDNIDNENLSLLTINVFPNPIQDKFTLSFENLKTQELQISIYNSIGQEIKSNSIQEILPAGQHSILFDLQSTLPSGQYFLIIKSKNGSQGIPIIKL